MFIGYEYYTNNVGEFKTTVLGVFDSGENLNDRMSDYFLQKYSENITAIYDEKMSGDVIYVHVPSRLGNKNDIVGKIIYIPPNTLVQKDINQCG